MLIMQLLFISIFLHVEAAIHTADRLTEYIVSVLTKYSPDPQFMVSQGYNGASVMSGQCSSEQKYIRELAPHAIHIHCYAYTLNLVLVDSVPYATEFLHCWSLCMCSYQPRKHVFM